MSEEWICYQCFRPLTDEEIADRDYLRYNGDGPHCKECYNDLYNRELWDGNHE